MSHLAHPAGRYGPLLGRAGTPPSPVDAKLFPSDLSGYLIGGTSWSGLDHRAVSYCANQCGKIVPKEVTQSTFSYASKPTCLFSTGKVADKHIQWLSD